MKLFSSSLASVRKIFKDTFNRPNQSGLGTASDGSSWNQIRSGFDIVGNKAQSNTTNYPMAVVNMPTQNNQVSISDISQGAAVSLWVTDAGNWWTVGIVQEEQACNCQTCTNCEAYSGINCATFGIVDYNPTNYGYISTNPIFYAIGSYNPANYGIVGGQNARHGIVGGENARYGVTGGQNPVTYGVTGGGNPRFGRISPTRFGVVGSNPLTYGVTGGGNPRTGIIGYNPANYGITSYNPANYGVVGGENPRYVTFGGTDNYGAVGGGNPIYGCTAFNTNDCVSSFSYDCNCQTCYPQYIRILQSVGATVSTITSWLIGTVSNSPIVQSLIVKTNNNEITVKPYSDPNLVTQIGDDLVYTATGVNITANYGITIAPSTYNQGYSIGEVEIKRNP